MQKYLVLAMSACFMSAPALADNGYPARPVRLIVAASPGSGGDALGRLLAEKLSGPLKGKVIVENKPGAGGAIATGFTARSAPDGYTIMLGSLSTHVLLPVTNHNLTYDPIKDFVALGQIGTASTLMIAAKDLPANNVREVVELAKNTPGGLSYASWGNGSTGHFCGELFNYKLKASITHIPYKSVAQIQTDLVGGHVKLAFVDMGSGTNMVKSGKAKAIISCTDRTHNLPEVPSYVDEKIDFQGRKPGTARWVMYAPAGTPAEIVQKLASAFQSTVELPDVKAWMLEQGISPVYLKGDRVRELNREDIRFWTDLAKAASIQSQ